MVCFREVLAYVIVLRGRILIHRAIYQTLSEDLRSLRSPTIRRMPTLNHRAIWRHNVVCEPQKMALTNPATMYTTVYMTSPRHSPLYTDVYISPSCRIPLVTRVYIYFFRGQFLRIIVVLLLKHVSKFFGPRTFVYLSIHELKFFLEKFQTHNFVYKTCKQWSTTNGYVSKTTVFDESYS